MTAELHPEQTPVRENEFIPTAVLEPPEQSLNEPLANSLTELFSNIFHRAVEYIGDRAPSRPSRTVAARLAIGTLAFGGLGLASAESSASAKFSPTVRAATASGSQNPNCGQYQDIMSPGQVAQAIHQPTGHTGQSIVGAALSAVRHAGPSGRHVTHQPGSTDTEMDAYYRARLGNSHELGTYVFEIDYNGRLTPKDVQSIKLAVVPGTFSGIYWRSHAQYLRDRYDFWISHGEYGNEGPKALNWSVLVDYGQKKNPAGSFALYSTLANGAEFGKPDLNLTPATLRSVDSQFIHVAKSAEAHSPINYQLILPSLKNERAC